MAHSSEIDKLEQRYRENPKGRNFAPLADAYRKAGLIDNAIELCQGGLKLHPDYVSAHIVHARCLVDKKDDAGAEDVFRRVLSLDPENVLALRTLAEISERGGHPEATVEWLTRLLEADPMNGEAAESLARAKAKVAASRAAEPVAVRGPEPPPAPQPPLAPAAVEAPAAGPVDAGLNIERASAPPSPASSSAPPPPASSSVPPPPEPAPAQAAPGLQTFDGSLDFGAVAGEAATPSGLELHEDVAIEPEVRALEGLAQTQYEAGNIAPRADPVDADEGVVDLPLIMPDEVEAASARRAGAGAAPAPPPPPVSDDDGAADRAMLSRAEPVVTETMAELYLKQGHREDALRVYRALLAQRPEDAALQRKIATLSGSGLRSGSGRSAGDFLRDVLRGAAPGPAGEAPAASPPGGVPGGVADLARLDAEAGTMLSQAFDEFEADGPAPGEPSRPADDAISLDSVFGEAGGEGAPTPERPVAAPSTAAPSGSAGGGGGGGGAGFSFDEFFSAPEGRPRGGAPDTASPPPKPRASSAPARPAADDEGDLDQFQDWLKKLKS